MAEESKDTAINSMTTTQRLAWVATHRVRTKILTYLDEFGEGSPVEMSRSPGLREWDIGVISYHCRKLLDLGVIRVKREIVRRGAMEHVYAAVDRPIIDTDQWSEIHPILRHAFTFEIGDRVLSDLVEAINADTIDSREDRHMTRTTALLDQQGWDEIIARMLQTYYYIEDRMREARDRLRESGEQGMRVSITQLCFELPGLE